MIPIEEMEAESKWISEELGNETPFHLSRYFPMYKRNDPPTPQETLFKVVRDSFQESEICLSGEYSG